jgi:hypothetical protein
VCTVPSVVCNGNVVCQQSGLCPSAGASTLVNKRRWVGSASGSCSERGPAWAACGVYGAGPRAWECVNTARDLESCTVRPLTLGVFVSVILTVSSLLVPPYCKKRWVAALFRSIPAFVTARTDLRFLASQTLHVCMANASSAAVSQVPARAHDGRSCVSF